MHEFIFGHSSLRHSAVHTSINTEVAVDTAVQCAAFEVKLRFATLCLRSLAS